MNVEFAVSKEGDFTGAKFKKATLKADDRWRASDETPAYGFDLLIAQKDGKLLFDHRYGPCHIEDLGAAKVTDELEVDLDKLEARQPQNVPIKEGHVYVILQSSWKHWILVRATHVEPHADANRR